MGCKDEGTCQVTINGRTGASILYFEMNKKHMWWSGANAIYSTLLGQTHFKLILQFKTFKTLLASTSSPLKTI